jgi:hypothetical protein
MIPRAGHVIPMLAALLVAPSAMAGEERAACLYGSTATCAPFACIPAAGPEVDRDAVGPNSPGFCGKCTEDADCGGAKCEVAEGTCSKYDAPPIPRPIRPHFNLVVADVSLNLADATSPKPIVAVGYMYQVALREAKPMVRSGGGWITPDLPTFYLNAGVSAAFAGATQNLFADAGLTYYSPGMPVALTTLSFGALYQRLGPSIWNGASGNSDRLGPAATLGFLQNLYVRGAYVFAVHGPVDDGAFILSLVYMRDLADDLVPDRFKKYLPEAFR